MNRQEFFINSKSHTINGVIENFEEPKTKIVIMLIHGSGYSDRDGSVIYKGKLVSQNFKILSESLANNGIAVCRYDKREKAQIKQLKEDAELVISYLKEKYCFKKIILYGWSEGVRVISETLNDKVNIDGLILQSGLISGWKNYFKYILGDVTLKKLFELDKDNDEIVNLSDFDRYESDFSSSSFSIDTILLCKDKGQISFNPLITNLDSIYFDDWKKVAKEISDDPQKLCYYSGLSYMEDWSGSVEAFKDYSNPVLLIHGLNDGWISIDESVKLARTIGEKATIELYPCLGHSMQKTRESFNDVGGKMETVVIKKVGKWIYENF